LTGHLVFTTVHANNVFDVLGRFLHMGIDAYNFVSCLNCVAAQRLVRKICPHCKQQVKYNKQTLVEAGLSYEKYRKVKFYEGAGCEECHGTGYLGRSAIMELLDMNDELRELIVSKAPVSKLKEAAREAGTLFLRQSAIEKVIAGVSTLPEINRVTFIEQDAQ
jgi:type IV pilus assembly protein PilB